MSSSPSPVRAAASVDVAGLVQDLEAAAASDNGEGEKSTFFSTISSNGDIQLAVLHSLVVAEVDNARTRKALETMPGVLDMLLKWYRSVLRPYFQPNCPPHSVNVITELWPYP